MYMYTCVLKVHCYCGWTGRLFFFPAFNFHSSNIGYGSREGFVMSTFTLNSFNGRVDAHQHDYKRIRVSLKNVIVQI